MPAKPPPPAPKLAKSGSAVEEMIPCDNSAREDWKRLVGKIAAPAKFYNNLPNIPFDPKFLNRPLSSLQKHVMHTVTTLDHEYKIPILTEPDLGVCPNLVDPEAYRLHFNRASQQLSEEDLTLIDQARTRGVTSKSYRPKHSVAWMKKAEYMANEAYQANPIAQYKSRSSVLEEYSNRQVSQDDQNKSNEQKISEIEATFVTPELGKLKKKGKPQLKAVKMTPILPAASNLWANLYTQVMFDDDPFDGQSDTGMEAVMKPFKKHVAGLFEQFLQFIVPNRDEPVDEHGQLYKWRRNYSYRSEPQEKVLMFTQRDDHCIGYNLVEAKLAVHHNSDKSFSTDRVKLKRREFKRVELEPRRKRQHVMMTELDIKAASEQDEELFTREGEREEVEEQARLLEAQQAERHEAAQGGLEEEDMSGEEKELRDEEMDVDQAPNEGSSPDDAQDRASD